MVCPGVGGEAVAYVWESGLLALRTREALEDRREIVVESFDRSF